MKLILLIFTLCIVNAAETGVMETFHRLGKKLASYFERLSISQEGERNSSKESATGSTTSDCVKGSKFNPYTNLCMNNNQIKEFKSRLYPGCPDGVFKEGTITCPNGDVYKKVTKDMRE